MILSKHLTVVNKSCMKLDILAIGSHPDDVELGCSGTIAKEISKGKKVGILDLTKGELGTRGSAEIREKEANDAAKIVNVAFRDNLEFKDEIYIGIRPEDISLKSNCEIQVDVKVDLVENLGFEKIIYSTASNKEINVKTSDNILGKTLRISFSKDKIYLFDKSRNRIR